MRETGEKSQVAENRNNSPIDISVTSNQYLHSMKTKKQSNVFPLRFMNKTQRDTIRKAAKLQGRSMNNYILRIVVSRAAADIQSQADAALANLAS